MDEKKKEQVRKEARGLLDKFSKRLASVKLKDKKIKEEFGGMREEGEGNDTDSDFRKRFFANTPKKEGDFIIAEKRKW